MYDIVTFGEAMIRLTPPDSQRLEQAHVFNVNASGSELNTAWGTVRLGPSTTWVSRLVDNPLMTTSGDAAIVFGVEGEPADSARQFAEKHGLKVAALTICEAPWVLRSKWSSVAVTGEGQTYASSAKIDLELIDRVGSGDAYDAGFLYELLTGDVAKAVRHGDAMSAIKHSVPGDHGWITPAEVRAHVEQPRTRIVRWGGIQCKKSLRLWGTWVWCRSSKSSGQTTPCRSEMP